MMQKIQKKIYDIFKKYGNRVNIDLSYFVKNGFWVGIRQVITVISGIILYSIFARFLDKEILGQYQFILSTWAIVSIFSIPGLNTSIMTAVAKGKDGNYKEVVKKSFLWSLIGIPILWIIGGYYLKTKYALGVSFLVTSIFFPFFYAFNTWNSFLQGKSKFDVSAWYFSIQAIVNTVASIAAIFLYKNNLLIITSCYLATFTFFNVFYYYKSLNYIENDKSDDTVMGYGWFLTKMSFLGIIAENIDKIILATFLSPSALAIYSIISIFPLKMRDATKPVLDVFFPKFVVSNGDLNKIIREKKGPVIIFVFFIVLSSIIYYILIENVSRLFFGDSYGQYYYFSKYFTIFFILYMPLTLMVRYAQAKRFNSTILVSDSSYYIIKIIFSIIFILWMGILGAVIAFNASFLIWFIFYLYGLFFKKQKINAKEIIQEGH